MHTGDTPWQCDRPDCSAKFAVRGELRAHVRIAHLQQASSNPDSHSGEQIPSLGALERDESSELSTEKAVRTDEAHVQAASADALKEAEEIADNCAYFATQLRAARVRFSWRLTDAANNESQSLTSTAAELSNHRLGCR